ncbi:amino acid--tRNA ligase-related protein, partial [uncultured Abyssibacter sp.]|uniref:amino acid--tRNA ligase-related protein n=1 Tax=uncultured Abyssibacter sp. TaxID=2320202 RepID=UPI0032B1C05C
SSGLRDLLFSHCVQPGLGRDGPVFLTGFAAADASFARLDPADETRALRFELYWSGVELANGGEELTDPAQWRQRADRDRARRCALGLPAVPPDEDWAAALDTGLPAASGVALGVDRLLMLAEGCRSITEVAPFARS